MKYDTREDYEDFIFNDYIDIEAAESFEDVLSRYSTNLDEVRSNYADFLAWYNRMLERIGAKCRHKALVCLDFLKYAETNPVDDDIIKFWCVCISEENYFLFDQDDDERCNLTGYLRLNDDVDNYFRRIKSENDVRERFHNLLDNITFQDKSVITADVSSLYHAFCIDGGLKGVCLKDNLDYVNEMICHSEELAKIAPLVYYSLFARYRKKLLETIGYEPNFKKILRRMEYVIDMDNGKNIDTFEEHIAIYRCACCYCDNSYDRYLCDIGFAEMSNIVDCTMLDWTKYTDITLPLRNELTKKYFSAFPGGLNENPIFIRAGVELDALSNFEEIDENRIESLKIIPKIKKYFEEHPETLMNYAELLRKNKANECMPIVFDVVDNSGVKEILRKACTMDVLNAVVIEELHSSSSSFIQSKMWNILNLFNTTNM